MKILNYQKFKDECESSPRRFGAILGNFDGVHLGHQKLLSEFLAHCQRLSIEPVLFTYTEHPFFFFNKEQDRFLLYDSKTNFTLLSEQGIHKIVLIDFTEDLQQTNGQEFIKSYFETLAGIELFFGGHDTTLGADRLSMSDIKPDQILIENIIQNSHVERFEEKIISSSKIRDCFRNGEIQEVNTLEGRRHFLSGLVVRGKGIGSKKLYPTYNLEIDINVILPKKGVYISLSYIEGTAYKSVTNIGINPSIDDSKIDKVETFIIEEEFVSMPVNTMKVELLEFIREEIKFDDISELKKQITADIQTAKTYHERN